ncbi:hypothetical protein PsalMR5_00317 [Piscirickettsia salmonis]|uniref:hypothetical protein n=1 Tax=Piscirickettsia salmonis TaxID=1238 RepID=UPI001E526554|nr:hypothetical protein [Piscirickettsia salmonis]QGP52914.1 hypothetical protein PsalSR1_00313 [Piscirickettsia salmonis]QGP61160.1 hypothetical protein PsalBI1_03789 [Piscirickettsia salmonis]QGP62486.1 hypothetical protein PsalMR5_00317 [Piscirickettsia salmonis]
MPLKKLQENYQSYSLTRLLNYEQFLHPRTVANHTSSNGLNYSAYSDSQHREAITAEIIRRIEAHHISKPSAKQATAILDYHTSLLAIRTAQPLQKVLTNPETFIQLYAPEIPNMDQRELVNLYAGIKKGIILPWANDVPHSLKAVKYTLMAKVEKKGIDSDVKPEEVSVVIDDHRYRRRFQPFSTNARKHIDGLEDNERLKQALKKPSEPPKLIFQATLEKQEKAIADIAEDRVEDMKEYQSYTGYET